MMILLTCMENTNSCIICNINSGLKLIHHSIQSTENVYFILSASLLKNCRKRNNENLFSLVNRRLQPKVLTYEVFD